MRVALFESPLGIPSAGEQVLLMNGANGRPGMALGLTQKEAYLLFTKPIWSPAKSAYADNEPGMILSLSSEGTPGLRFYKPAGTLSWSAP
jgi:hypothetical protein